MKKKRKKYYGQSNYPVPGRGSRRGCLGKDGTYSVKNCDDHDLWAQGIGDIGG